MASLISAGTSTNTALNITGDTTGVLALATNNGTTAVTIDTAQNVGIGVTPSAWGSNFKAIQIGASGNIGSQTSAKTIEIASNAYNNSGWKYQATDKASLYYQYDGAHNWSTAASGTAGNAITFTQAMTLDSSGNLGIGTTSPTSQLHLAKALSSTQTNMLQIQNTGTFTWGIGVDNAVSNSSLLIQSGGAGGTTRLALDSSGNLLMGTTSTIGNNGKFCIVSAGGATNDFYVTKPTVNQYYNPAIFLNSSGTNIGYIQCSTSTTSYSTSSDYRLKNTITPMTGALAKVAQLKPVTYKWNSDGSNGEGFIAHELQQVVPDCVTGEKDAVDADGNPKYQGIDTSFLVATLTAAIQELKTIVDAQAVEIAALKAKVGS